jgi:hypothetical protein
LLRDESEELEWQHLKRDELSGLMFNSEDELESALHSRYDSNSFATLYFQLSYAYILRHFFQSRRGQIPRLLAVGIGILALRNFYYLNVAKLRNSMQF